MAESPKEAIQKMVADLSQNSKVDISGIESRYASQLADLKAKISSYDQRISSGERIDEKRLGRQNGEDVLQYERRGFQTQLNQLEQARANDINNAQNSPEAQRGREMAQGAQFGATVLGEGLGRMGGSADIEALRSKYQQFAEGYGSAESQARQEQAYQGINQATTSQMRQLQGALAKAGVRGGVAGSQLRDVQVAGMQKKADVQRDLFISGEEAKRSGTQALTEFTTGILQYDQSQAAKEKDIVLQAALGQAQMGVAERGAAAAASASAAAAASQRSCFMAGAMVDMHDGSSKDISTLKIGDMTYLGGRVTAWGMMEVETEFYRLGNTFVTGSHVLFEDGRWINAEDSNYLQFYGKRKTIVFPLNTEKGYYIVNRSIQRNFTECEGTYSPEEALQTLNSNKKDLEWMSLLDGMLKQITPPFPDYSIQETGPGSTMPSLLSRMWQFVEMRLLRRSPSTGEQGRISV